MTPTTPNVEPMATMQTDFETMIRVRSSFSKYLKNSVTGKKHNENHPFVNGSRKSFIHKGLLRPPSLTLCEVITVVLGKTFKPKAGLEEGSRNPNTAKKPTRVLQ